MAGLIDSDAVLVEFEAWLVEDGRASHGTAHLCAKLAELRAAHRVHEDAERARLRRFAADLQDTFLGLMPLPATSGPLSDGDLRASSAMEAGATVQSTPMEAQQCPRPKPKRANHRSLPTPA